MCGELAGTSFGIAGDYDRSDIHAPTRQRDCVRFTSTLALVNAGCRCNLAYDGSIHAFFETISVFMLAGCEVVLFGD